MDSSGTSLPAYTVFVRSNSQYQDKDEEYKLTAFNNCQSAMNACKKIVDDFLSANFSPGITSDGLHRQYTMFGEDPFIVSASNDCPFSAWEYAKQRCEELCEEKKEAIAKGRYICRLVHDCGDHWSWQYYGFFADSVEEAKKKLAALAALMHEAPHALFHSKKSNNSQISITDDELRAISKFSEEMKNISRDELAKIVSGFTSRGTEGDFICWGVDISGKTYMRHEFTEGEWEALCKKHEW